VMLNQRPQLGRRRGHIWALAWHLGTEFLRCGSCGDFRSFAFL